MKKRINETCKEIKTSDQLQKYGQILHKKKQSKINRKVTTKPGKETWEELTKPTKKLKHLQKN